MAGLDTWRMAGLDTWRMAGRDTWRMAGRDTWRMAGRNADGRRVWRRRWHGPGWLYGGRLTAGALVLLVVTVAPVAVACPDRVRGPPPRALCAAIPAAGTGLAVEVYRLGVDHPAETDG
jgi:hypothetical protein